MRIIKNWRPTLYAYSTWALTAAAGIPALWLSVPEEVKILVPPKAMAVITAAVALGGLAGRFVDQTRLVRPEDRVNSAETSE
jgi:hypothetical protein